MVSYSYSRVGWVLISILGHESVGRYIKESVTQGQCDARPTVTFPTAEHCHCHLAGTRFLSCQGQEGELAGYAAEG